MDKAMSANEFTLWLEFEEFDESYPCHMLIKTYQPLQVASKLMREKVLLSDRCCGEAGIFAIARPDIAIQLRYRKQKELQEGVNQYKRNQ